MATHCIYFATSTTFRHCKFSIKPKPKPSKIQSGKLQSNFSPLHCSMLPCENSHLLCTLSRSTRLIYLTLISVSNSETLVRTNKSMVTKCEELFQRFMYTMDFGSSSFYKDTYPKILKSQCFPFLLNPSFPDTGKRSSKLWFSSQFIEFPDSIAIIHIQNWNKK